MVSESLQDFTVVVTSHQLQGRGQMGTVWEAEACKNLTFSVLKKLERFSASDQFLLNSCVSLAVLHALREVNVPDLSVKWPNDILSGRTKIGGILIENSIKGTTIPCSILGIGLNVNQTEFKNLPNVSSLKLILGYHLNLDELLIAIVEKMKAIFLELETGKVTAIKLSYEKELFRKDKPSTFEDRNGKRFMGYIRGVSSKGKLLVDMEHHILKEFELKEIKLLY
jgi:BirA family biotin operon repressor/biotin-[acetyl-CoA-carboxylase] ligase